MAPRARRIPGAPGLGKRAHGLGRTCALRSDHGAAPPALAVPAGSRHAGARTARCARAHDQRTAMAHRPPHGQPGAFQRREPHHVPPRPAGPHPRLAGTGGAAARLQPAHARTRTAAAPRTRQRARRHTPARGGGAGAPAHRRLPLHARARRVRPAHRRRILVRPPPGLLRTHRQQLRHPHARARHSRAHRHRLPGRRDERRRRLLDRAPARRPRLGRGLAGRPGLGARGPHRGGRARARRLAAAAERARRRHRRRHPQPQPQHRCPAARGLGGDEQQLEPVGAELHPGPPARPAQEPGLSLAQLGGPGLRADRCGGAGEPDRRGLDTVGAPAARPLVAPAAARPRAPQGARPGQQRPHAPRELAQRVRQHWGASDAARRVAQWLLQLEAQRYGRPGAADTPTLATLQTEFRQLAWPRKDPR